MNADKKFDRWAACCFAIIFALIAFVGMWFKNGDVADFGKYGFATFSGVVITLLNRELLGNGNGNGSGNANPTEQQH